MRIRPATEPLVKAAVVGAAGRIIDTGVALPHQAAIVKLPILFTERSRPVPTVVAPLLSKPTGDTSALVDQVKP